MPEENVPGGKFLDYFQDLMAVVVYLAPFIQKLVPLDCMIGVSDREKFLAIVNGREIKLPVNAEGLPVPREDAIYMAMRDKKPVDMIVPEEAFGFEFKSTAVPIMDRSGQVIGGLGLGIGLANREKLFALAESVSASSQETATTIEELTRSAERLARYQEALSQLGQEVAEEVKNTAAILKFIRGIAQNSNLLGLNAAIEAARAGEQGRGFSVVAEEIRKMADNSGSAVKNIEAILLTVKRKTETMLERVVETAAIGEQQLAAAEEISSAMEELAASAEELEKAASLVIG